MLPIKRTRKAITLQEKKQIIDYKTQNELKTHEEVAL